MSTISIQSLFANSNPSVLHFSVGPTYLETSRATTASRPVKFNPGDFEVGTFTVDHGVLSVASAGNELYSVKVSDLRPDYAALLKAAGFKESHNNFVPFIGDIYDGLQGNVVL